MQYCSKKSKKKTKKKTKQNQDKYFVKILEPEGELNISLGSENDLIKMLCLFVFYFLLYFITLHYCIVFAIYQNESTTGIHVFPNLFFQVIDKGSIGHRTKHCEYANCDPQISIPC